MLLYCPEVAVRIFGLSSSFEMYPAGVFFETLVVGVAEHLWESDSCYLCFSQSEDIPSHRQFCHDIPDSSLLGRSGHDTPDPSPP